MRILHVWDADYPWDVRVEKISQTLIKAGHEVHLVARNRKGATRYEHLDGVHVHRLPALPPPFRMLNGPLTFPAFFSPLWIREITRVARDVRPDLVLARDLPLAPAAAMVARALGRPCVFDMAECYPEMLKTIWRHERFKLHNVVVRNPWFAYLLERWTVRHVDHILVMVEESRQRLIRLGVNADRISIVSNTPDVRRFPTRTQVPSDRPLRLTYVGGLSVFRGLDIVLQAAARYQEHNPRFEVQLVGAGPGEPMLRRLVVDLGIAARVRFEGFIENHRIPGVIADADIGVVPHRKDSHSCTTIPNKLFDYMAAAKPVLATDVTPVQRVLDEARCGLVYRDGDVADLVTQWRKFEDPQIRAAMGRNGRRAIETVYNWDHDAHILLEAIHRAAHHNPS
jgi:glycosyltransferase involved in cell wall biosynthesis